MFSQRVLPQRVLQPWVASYSRYSTWGAVICPLIPISTWIPRRRNIHPFLARPHWRGLRLAHNHSSKVYQPSDEVSRLIGWLWMQ